MEFAYKSYFNTTTAATVDSNTLTVENMLNRDIFLQYQSEGYDDDLTTTSIVISFDETTTISRIGLINQNWKDFTAFYNGSTASTFTISGLTTTTDFTNNSATSLYLTATPVECTSVTFDITKTITADQEKAIGSLILSKELLDFERIPAANGYKPKLNPKQVTHKMSDGGTRVHTISEKWSTEIKYKYITENFRDELKTVWSLRDEFIFVPFPTSSSWDGILYESVWPGPFEFYRYTDNAVNAGYSGSIRLMETPW